MTLSSYLILYMVSLHFGHTTIAYFGMFLAVLEFLRLCTEKSAKVSVKYTEEYYVSNNNQGVK